MTDYHLGPVKPWVKNAADIIGAQFHVTTIYGVASRSYSSDHPLGLALDFMVYGDRAKGQQIADFAVAQAPFLGVHYVIWYQQIWNKDRASEGWRPMEDRGSITANHMDHVHVSFNATSPIVPYGNGNTFDLPKVPNPLGAFDGAKELLSWLSDSHNWLRIGLILAGVVLLIVAIVQLGITETGVVP